MVTNIAVWRFLQNKWAFIYGCIGLFFKKLITTEGLTSLYNKKGYEKTSRVDCMDWSN
jgi:hypothetical protein